MLGTNPYQLFCCSPNCTNKCGKKVPPLPFGKSKTYDTSQLMFFCDRNGSPLFWNSQDNKFEQTPIKPKLDK